MPQRAFILEKRYEYRILFGNLMKEVFWKTIHRREGWTIKMDFEVMIWIGVYWLYVVRNTKR